MSIRFEIIVDDLLHDSQIPIIFCTKHANVTTLMSIVIRSQ